MSVSSNHSDSPVVLITGAARRVGAQIARHLHAAGYAVAVHCRASRGEAQVLCDELNAARAGSAAVFTADLLDTAAIAPLVADVVAHFGRLDALVNNASSFYRTPLGQIDGAVWDDLIGSNFKAPLFLAQAAAPHLRAAGGAIVNITDVHAKRPLRGFPVYSAAKGGLLNLTRALAIELAPLVRVNAVAPGAIEWPQAHSPEVSAGDTALSVKNASDDDAFPPEERAAIIAHTLLGRIGSPDDIARTVKFLLLDAPYITGQVINVDGGRTAHL
jgi:pteridine reductase